MFKDESEAANVLAIMAAGIYAFNNSVGSPSTAVEDAISIIQKAKQEAHRLTDD